MNQSFQGKRTACMSVFLLSTIACSNASDPASETPVNAKPGQYEITLSGAGLMKQAGKGKSSSYCLTQGESASFPYRLAEKFYPLHPACQTRRQPREGNAIAGEFSCGADPKLAAGANRFIYKGVVAEENVSVEIRMKLDATIKESAMTKKEAAQLRLGMKALEQARFVIGAKRTGDC